MSDLLIRNLSAETKRALRIKAAENGRSLSEEAAKRLEASFPSSRDENWYVEMRKLVERYGAFELELPPRKSYQVNPLDLSGPAFDT